MSEIKRFDISDVPTIVLVQVLYKWEPVTEWDDGLNSPCAMCDWVQSELGRWYGKCTFCPIERWCDVLINPEYEVDWKENLDGFVDFVENEVLKRVGDIK